VTGGRFPQTLAPAPSPRSPRGRRRRQLPGKAQAVPAATGSWILSVRRWRRASPSGGGDPLRGSDDTLHGGPARRGEAFPRGRGGGARRRGRLLAGGDCVLSASTGRSGGQGQGTFDARARLGVAEGALSIR
jgi:hypothetical protein